jgi:hypothetical protein
MKNNKLYQILLLGSLIILISISYFNQRVRGVEGFAPWYSDEYNLMPAVITLLFTAPAIFLIYLVILRNLNRVFTGQTEG